MRKVMLWAIALAAIVSVIPVVVFAWPKDGGMSCNEVFAKIQNDQDDPVDWDGYVKANGQTVFEDSGTKDPGEWAEVSWNPPDGFSGEVEAFVRFIKPDGSTWDSMKVSGSLDCPAPPTNTPPAPSGHADLDRNGHTVANGNGYICADTHTNGDVATESDSDGNRGGT